MCFIEVNLQLCVSKSWKLIATLMWQKIVKEEENTKIVSWSKWALTQEQVQHTIATDEEEEWHEMNQSESQSVWQKVCGRL